MNNAPIIVNEKLLNAICNADSTIQKAYKLKNEEQDLRRQAKEHLRNAEEKRQEHQKNRYIYAVAFTFPVFMGIAFIAIGLGFDIFDMYADVYNVIGRLIPPFLTWIIPMVPIALLIFFVANLIPCKDKEELANAAMFESMADEKRNELEAFIEANRNHVAIVAPEFRYPVASQELVKLFQLGRATTLPEAYDKLELKLHQMRVERKLDTIIASQYVISSLLSQIEYNTRWLDYSPDYDYDYDDF